MTRILWVLAFAATLVAGVALAQTQSGTTAPSGTTVQQQQMTPTTTTPASTPPAGGTSSTTPSTTTPSGGARSMPATASPMPLVGAAGLIALLAAIGLSLRRRDA